MLWLKAWLETRWKIAYAVALEAAIVGLPLRSATRAPAGHPQALASSLLQGILLAAFLVATMLAGSGVQTAAATRPGTWEKGGAGSTLFTLCLPVPRTRLFAVRTAVGTLETTALLTLLLVAAWRLLPPMRVDAHDALGTVAAIVSLSLVIYAMSACLSTFCDEGWRTRLCMLALVAASTLPRSMNVFRLLVLASPLFTHRIPWTTIVTVCVLAVLFLATAAAIVQRREY